MVEVETTKSGMLAAIRRGWQQFQAAIADVEDEELEEEGIEGDWTIRDIMAHIMFWEEKMTGWLLDAEAERRPGVYEEELSGERIQEWNDANYHRQRSRSLQDVMIQATEVHSHLMDVLARLPEDPRDPRYELWADGKPPWQLIAENTYKHYEEHIESIRNFLASKNA